ncbi:hypothetical protein [Chitinimonas lacunae]|uniref:Porin n=1 Tax=Chitinimonas lacunae TaxID=1963018 RepID=A0ABV8MLT8_9NEIS
MGKWLSLITLVVQSAVCAEDTERWRLGGFGTLGITHSDTPYAQYRGSAQQSNGIFKEWSFKNETVLGVQGSVSPLDSLDLTIQLLSRHNYKNNFDPQLDWAYIAWRARPSLTLRAGRFITPMLMVSDYRNVNYSNPWIRPPLEFYGLLTLNNVDGVDALYRGNLGEMTYALQGFWGKYDLYINTARLIEYHRMIGFNATLQRDPWMVRLAYMDSDHSLADSNGNKMNISRAQIGPPGCGGLGCERVYPGFARLAEQFDVEHKPFRVLAIGGSYDDGKWLIQSELAYRDNGDSQVASGSAWYLSVARRLGDWLPYAVVARHKANTREYILQPSPEFANRPALVLRNSSTDQSSLSIGLRRELGKHAAIKFQHDWLKPEHGRYTSTFGNGNLLPNSALPPNTRLSDFGSVRIIAVSLDFIF